MLSRLRVTAIVVHQTQFIVLDYLVDERCTVDINQMTVFQKKRANFGGL